MFNSVVYSGSISVKVNNCTIVTALKIIIIVNIMVVTVY